MPFDLNGNTFIVSVWVQV